MVNLMKNLNLVIEFYIYVPLSVINFYVRKIDLNKN